MERLRSNSYAEELARRSRKSRAYTRHQLAGLEIADLLLDRRHTSLYIKLAKEYGPDKLLKIAKLVVEKSKVKNRGAYFMTLLKTIVPKQ